MPAGCGVWIGWPFASSPLAQFTLDERLTEDRTPVSRSSE